MSKPSLTNYYMSRQTEQGSVIGLSVLTNRRAAAAGLDASKADGYFLYEAKACDTESVHIIARVESDEAALRLKALLGLE